VTLMIAPDESAGKREWMSALRSRFERGAKSRSITDSLMES
jgi:hypothetical protein